MGITTAKIVESICYKINYTIKWTNGRIYILRSIQSGGKDIRFYLDEGTGEIHTDTTEYDMDKLFSESYEELTKECVGRGYWD